jgi:hypothetical protein
MAHDMGYQFGVGYSYRPGVKFGHVIEKGRVVSFGWVKMDDAMTSATRLSMMETRDDWRIALGWVAITVGVVGLVECVW